MAYTPVPRGRQQLGGLFIALLGAGGWGWSWYTAVAEGAAYRNAAVLAPSFFVLGVGLVLFPGYKEERLARGEDITGLEGAALLTPRWWAILAASLGLGLGNWAAMTLVG